MRDCSNCHCTDGGKVTTNDIRMGPSRTFLILGAARNNLINEQHSSTVRTCSKTEYADFRTAVSGIPIDSSSASNAVAPEFLNDAPDPSLSNLNNSRPAHTRSSCDFSRGTRDAVINGANSENFSNIDNKMVRIPPSSSARHVPE